MDDFSTLYYDPHILNISCKEMILFAFFMDTKVCSFFMNDVFAVFENIYLSLLNNFRAVTVLNLVAYFNVHVQSDRK